eukprot:3825523-Amphidinium_carterae.1
MESPWTGRSVYNSPPVWGAAHVLEDRRVTRSVFAQNEAEYIPIVVGPGAHACDSLLSGCQSVHDSC